MLTEPVLNGRKRKEENIFGAYKRQWQSGANSYVAPSLFVSFTRWPPCFIPNHDTITCYQLTCLPVERSTTFLVSCWPSVCFKCFPSIKFRRCISLHNLMRNWWGKTRHILSLYCFLWGIYQKPLNNIFADSCQFFQSVSEKNTQCCWKVVENTALFHIYGSFKCEDTVFSGVKFQDGAPENAPGCYECMACSSSLHVLLLLWCCSCVMIIGLNFLQCIIPVPTV